MLQADNATASKDAPQIRPKEGRNGNMFISRRVISGARFMVLKYRPCRTVN
jgi:hypothetical protein